jgi:hypothetical protein
MSEKTYITIEETGSTFRKTISVFDDKEATLYINKIENINNLDNIKKPRMKVDKLIIGLLPERATTIESIIKIKRDDPKLDITKEEIDKLIFKALWEFLNTYRSWSFKKMDITDLDLILANVQVVEVLLDNKRVFDPVNFNGKELNISLRGTFVSRDTLSIFGRFKEYDISVDTSLLKLTERVSLRIVVVLSKSMP